MPGTAVSRVIEKEAESRSATSVWLQVASRLDPKFGGPAIVVPSLAAAAERGPHVAPVAAFCGPSEDISHIDARRLHVFRFPQSRGRWMREKELQEQLRELLESADGVHIHGIWEEHCAIASALARRCGKPYLVAAHGMLEGWALRQKRLKKLLYSLLVERANLRHAVCLHALTRREVDDYRRFGLRNPVAVIPNGVDVPAGVTPADFRESFPHLDGKRVVLFLGRLHRKKGLDILCQAWSRAARRFPEAHLVIAGPDFDHHRAAVEASVKALAISDSVTFTGMLDHRMKWSALAAASLFVLPSYSEGFSVATLEALAMGVPALITRQCNFPEVGERRCGAVTEAAAEPLEEALTGLLSAGAAETAAMKRNARALIAERYTWTAIGRQVNEVYDWILGGPLPSSVEISRCGGGSK